MIATRFVLAFALVLAACQSAPLLTCGEPSPLVDDPLGAVVPGMRLGPLLITTGMWEGQRTAQLHWDRPEQLTKFLVPRIEPFAEPLAVVGRRCSDGRPLRFAMTPPWSADATLSLEDIAQRTTVTFPVDALPASDIRVGNRPSVSGGYFIFTAAGRWRIEVTDGHRVLDSGFIEVTGR